jgi:hypothetical protein
MLLSLSSSGSDNGDETIVRSPRRQLGKWFLGDQAINVSRWIMKWHAGQDGMRRFHRTINFNRSNEDIAAPRDINKKSVPVPSITQGATQR